jgi:hypothetical protein
VLLVNTVLLSLLGLFALLILLLAVPIVLTFRFDNAGFEGMGAFKGQVTIRWLFGLARIRIPVPGDSRQHHSATKLQAAKKRGKFREPGARSNFVAVLRQAKFRQRVYRLVKDLIRAVGLRQLRLRMRLGLGDPSDTGCLWAFVGPLNAAAQYLRNAEVRIEPEFMDAVFEFHARGQVRVVPLQLVGLAIGFALSPASIRAWRTLKGNHV